MAKVLSVTLVQGRFPKIRCVIGDETGVVNAFLPEQDSIAVGRTIMLSRAEAKVVKEHIEIQLPGFGRIEEGRREVEKVNENFNLSEKSWVPMN